MASANGSHPVVDVYNQYRTARLNVKCLQVELKRLRRFNLGIELVLALSASSGAAGLFVFQTEPGQVLAKVFAPFTVLLAVLKPLLKLPSGMQKKEAMLSGYRGLEHDLEEITIGIRQEQSYNAELRKHFMLAMKRKGQLVKADGGFAPSRRLVRKMFDEVNKELPAESFYIPEETSNGN